METANKATITVQTTVNAPMAKVWECWTKPEHIMKWNFASDDLHSPRAENDLRPGGYFNYHMAAKDGSFGFDFGGTYTRIETHHFIEYIITDGRKVSITFKVENNSTKIEETFEAEHIHSLQMQQTGWQAILNNFKKHTEKEIVR